MQACTIGYNTGHGLLLSVTCCWNSTQRDPLSPCHLTLWLQPHKKAYALTVDLPDTLQIDVIFVHDKHSEGPPGAYALLLLTVLLVGVLDGISQGAIFGDAATLPSEYTHVRGLRSQ